MMMMCFITPLVWFGLNIFLHGACAFGPDCLAAGKEDDQGIDRGRNDFSAQLSAALEEL